MIRESAVRLLSGVLMREGSVRGRFWSGSMSDRREKKLAKSPNVDGGIMTVMRVRAWAGPPRCPRWRQRRRIEREKKVKSNYI